MPQSDKVALYFQTLILSMFHVSDFTHSFVNLTTGEQVDHALCA